MLNPYVEELRSIYAEYANDNIAHQQKAYLNNLFEHFGIKSPVRRTISKHLLTREALPTKEELPEIVYELWNQDQREFHHFGLDLCAKYRSNIAETDIDLYEWMVTHKSWWDTVDFIAVNLIGPFFKVHPELIDAKIKEWIAYDNLWLQRCTLIFQLKYKDQTNTERLSHCIHRLKDTKEFFLNKAIGWALREYGKTNPTWVIQFCNTTKLHSLSKREALRLINQ